VTKYQVIAEKTADEAKIENLKAKQGCYVIGGNTAPTAARPTSRKSRKPATTDGVNPWQKQNRQHLPKTAPGLCQTLDIYDTSGYSLNQ